MKFKDCHIYDSESGAGTPLQCLVPIGSAPKDIFRKQFKEYDGAEVFMRGFVSADTLKKHVESLKKPVTAEEMEQCRRIFEAYPLRVAPGAAYPKIKAALAEVEFPVLLGLTEAYATAVKAAGIELQFVPQPATWFSQKRWQDAPEMWTIRAKPGAAKPNHAAGF